MRIGIDFDNTIVCYDQLFHRVAVESALVPPETPVNKVAVRDYLRAIDQEDDWTRMQGQVYGKRILEAEPYPGLLDFLPWALGQGHQLFIISHRTLHPALGPAYDLHEAGRGWVAHRLCQNGRPLIPEDQVFFETSKQSKVDRAAACACDLFIDDLPEILRMPGFQPKMTKILFDPQGNHQGDDGVLHMSGWPQIQECLSSWI